MHFNLFKADLPRAIIGFAASICGL